MLDGRGRALIQLGLLLLIATPVARVAFSVFAFERQRDWTYVGITLFVLAVLRLQPRRRELKDESMLNRSEFLMTPAAVSAAAPQARQAAQHSASAVRPAAVGHHRRTVACRTPNLNRLAAAGMLFERPVHALGRLLPVARHDAFRRLSLA